VKCDYGKVDQEGGLVVKVRIQRWGHSLAVCIPESFAVETHIEQDTEVELTTAEGKLIISPLAGPEMTLEQLLEGVTPENLHDAFDTGPAVGGEVW
jgi:antitoxin MazE